MPDSLQLSTGLARRCMFATSIHLAVVVGFEPRENWMGFRQTEALVPGQSAQAVGSARHAALSGPGGKQIANAALDVLEHEPPAAHDPQLQPPKVRVTLPSSSWSSEAVV